MIAPIGDPLLGVPPEGRPRLIHVLPKPGVMDPVAQSVLAAIADFGLLAEAVRTLKKYWVGSLSDAQQELLCSKILANDAIEQVIVGPLPFDTVGIGAPYAFRLKTVPIGAMDDAALRRLSREGQLYLSLAEMQTIQAHFRGSGPRSDRRRTGIRRPDLERTLQPQDPGRTDSLPRRRGRAGVREHAPRNDLRRHPGDPPPGRPADWCVSVFEDNAGVVRFDDQFNVVFKVETHNHPSALEPYGGANTGLGGVIRDPMGTGLGAKPICNTDVFCFAPPDTPARELPAGVLHPRRVMKGVVSGVRDYGNRMGIPTVNGAIYFDRRYLGNPLVYCGNVGLIPRDKSRKQPRPAT